MRKIRVLVVDDSVVARRLVSDVLSADPAFEVVGTAATGPIALRKISQVNPDVITLDIEMPGMDGLATLREVRKIYVRLPVIMFSTFSERGAAATIEALTLGANDYVTKPTTVGSVGAGMEQVRSVLLPKIRALCPGFGSGEVLVATPRIFPRTPSGAPAGRGSVADIRVDVLAIACSTGGPNALAIILPDLPRHFPVPIVIVQHMPPMFTTMLAVHLSKKCQITVSEAVDGEPLRAGHALIAPGDYHLGLERRANGIVTRLHQGPPENSCRPAADVLFRSVAEHFPGHALGVVLTGMGRDGQRGSEHICATGGRILVQDEASSVVWGMAGSVAQAGLAEGMWPVGELGQAINRRMVAGHPGWSALPPALATI